MLSKVKAIEAKLDWRSGAFKFALQRRENLKKRPTRMQIWEKSRQKYYKNVNTSMSSPCAEALRSSEIKIARYLGLTLFGGRCYSRRVPFGRGFLLNVRQLGLSKLTRQGEPTTTKRLTPAVR
jgi:hypothetical protein